MANLLQVAVQKNQLQSHVPRDFVTSMPVPLAQPPMDEYGVFHQKLVTKLKNAFDLARTTRVQQAMNVLIELVDEYTGTQDPRIRDTLDDIVNPSPDRGQIIKALQNWSRWGQHYFPAVLCAHSNSVQANLKDASLKYYSSVNIKNMIDYGVKIYETQPPPKPDFVTTQTITANTLRNISQTPCFGPDCMIKLADATFRAAAEIKAGDKLWGDSTVVCVARSIQGVHQVIPVDYDIVLTPYHPYYNGNEWVFPVEEYLKTGKLEDLYNETRQVVYNLVLDSKHTIVVGSELFELETCTLGHGLTEPVVQHDYLGSKQVIEDLKEISGWEKGLVVITGIRRDLVTRKVCKFVGDPNVLPIGTYLPITTTDSFL